MAPIILYGNDGSPPCRSVNLLAKILGIEFDVKWVDPRKGEAKTPEFLKINPQHQIPVIDDNGFILQESRAILEYLAETYGKDDSLLPKDPKAKAVVHARLYFEVGSLYPRILVTYIIPKVFGTPVTEENKKGLDETLAVLDQYLSKSKWFAGNNMTIADISLIATVSSLDAIGHDLSQYANISKWYAECKKIPGYEVNQKGVDMMRQFFQQ